MKKSVIALIAAASVIGVSATAIAAMGGGHGMRGMHGMMNSDEPVKLTDIEAKVKTLFSEVDANKDGFIVETEVSAMRDRMRAARQDEHFTGMDTNKDGAISRAEFGTAHERRADAKDDMREKGMGGMGRGHHMGRHGGGHGEGGPGMGGGMFGRADANNDGKVSLAEALAKPTEHFKTMDANKDGTVTPEEHKAAREKMRANWKAKREG